MAYRVRININILNDKKMAQSVMKSLPQVGNVLHFAMR